MRLLKLHEHGHLTLTEYLINEIPRYAILSHTWGADKDEVTLDDVSNGVYKTKAGYDKIRFCGVQARQDGLEHFWVDTCCIDKTSSAELSEAINSMYTWYQKSAVCYVYLGDVHEDGDFGKSAWFSRGWTLQELIAAQDLFFYSSVWSSIGSKKELLSRLVTVTGITLSVLETGRTSDCSIAQRMSWAAKRITTRPEDMAYSLIGIFDINMSLLYGEGGKSSFLRLQQEIIKVYDDHSIFAWEGVGQGGQGLLAPCPACFSDCGHIKQQLVGLAEEDRQIEAFSYTNIGLSIRFWLLPWASDVYVTILDCASCSSAKNIGIFLQRTTEGGRQCARVAVDDVDRFYVTMSDLKWFKDPYLQLKQVLVRQKYFNLEKKCYTHAFVLHHKPGMLCSQRSRTEHDLANLCQEPCDGTLPLLQFPIQSENMFDSLVFPELHQIKAIKFGLCSDFTPFVTVFSSNHSMESITAKCVTQLVDDENVKELATRSTWSNWNDLGLYVGRGHWKAGLSCGVEFLNLSIVIEKNSARVPERQSGKWKVSLGTFNEWKRLQNREFSNWTVRVGLPEG